MDNISIEQFAAFLDGNLSMDDAQIVSAAISQDPMLQDMMDSNDEIEDYMQHNAESCLQVPDEILSMDFQLPQIDPALDLGSLNQGFPAYPTNDLSPIEFNNPFQGANPIESTKFNPLGDSYGDNIASIIDINPPIDSPEGGTLDDDTISSLNIDIN